VAKEEAAQQQALRALANREAHWDTLERARLELEALRMLLERVGRREKVKKQREFPTLHCAHFCFVPLYQKPVHASVTLFLWKFYKQHTFSGSFGCYHTARQPRQEGPRGILAFVSCIMPL